MVQEQVDKLKKVVEIVDNVGVNPDVTVDYFIPGVIVTENVEGHDEKKGPYIQFTYAVNGTDTHTQIFPLTPSDLEKSAEDLANYITFQLETFMAEMDSRQFGAQ
jgi:hypothetical protein